MLLSSFQSAYEATPPVVSAFLDVSRTEVDADHGLGLRWRAVREGLADQGAPTAAVAAIEERLLAPTGLGGELSRLVAADAAGHVVVDELHAGTGGRDHGHAGLLPHLMPAARLRAQETAYLLVQVDHSGADITTVDEAGFTAVTASTEGGHDVLHKVPGGGWSQRRYMCRVQDSWDRNAEHVAQEIDAIVARHRPELVFLTGDEYSRSAVRKSATTRVAGRLVDLEHGGRAAGIDEQLLHDEIWARLDEHRSAASRDRVEDFEQRLGRDEAVANGYDAVVTALREGAVEVLLLHDDPTSTLQLYAGEQALHLGRREDEVSALGATRIEQDRADEVVLRALVSLDAELVLLDDEPDGLKDGIGALLRFDIRPPAPGRGS